MPGTASTVMSLESFVIESGLFTDKTPPAFDCLSYYASYRKDVKSLKSIGHSAIPCSSEMRGHRASYGTANAVAQISNISIDVDDYMLEEPFLHIFFPRKEEKGVFRKPDYESYGLHNDASLRDLPVSSTPCAQSVIRWRPLSVQNSFPHESLTIFAIASIRSSPFHAKLRPQIN
eukprot:IDg4886t1